MGKSPMKTSCSLTSPLALLRSLTLTRTGAAYVPSRFLHSSREYLDSPKVKESKKSSRLPVKSEMGEMSLKIS